MDHEKHGKLVIIIGPSAGVGKTTIVSEVLKRLPSAARLVTSTTRAMREGEVDGVHYHFLSREEFERKRDRGEFLEWNDLNGKLYGSSRVAIENMLPKHDAVLATLDVNGARRALHAFPEALSIFIRPESIEQLRGRLVARGMPKDEIEWRLENARAEMATAHEFGTVVTNREGRLNEAVEDVIAVIEGRMSVPPAAV